MATLMEKDALLELVNGAIAKISTLKIDDTLTRQALYGLNAALLENPPEIFDFEGTVKAVKTMMEQYE